MEYKKANKIYAETMPTKICPRLCRAYTDLNSKIDARVVANVDGRINGWKTGSLYHAKPEAGVTKMDISIAESSIPYALIWEYIPEASSLNGRSKKLSCVANKQE